MRRWFDDSSMRSILRNTSLLGVSKGAAAIASLAVLALAARDLGPTGVGFLLLVHSYAMAASSLTHFQSWQVIVRYGSRPLEEGDPEPFRRAVSFALGLDLLTGIGGMLLAMALLPLLAGWFGIPDELRTPALLYCLLIPTMASGAANGVLRALDRFDLIAWQSPIDAYVRLALVTAAYVTKQDLIVYLVIWAATDLLGDLYLWSAAIRELRRRGLLKGLRPSIRAQGLEGGWRFAFTVNLTASVNSAWGPVARLLVGGLLSPAATGLYRVASSLIDAVQSPIDLMAKAVHPELMRHDPASAHPWRLMLRTMALGTVVAVLAWVVIGVFGARLITLLFGPEFTPAAPLLTVLLMLPVIATLAFPMPAMFYSLGRPAGPLVANIIGALVFVGSLPFLAASHGLVGAGAAIVVGRLTSLLTMGILLTSLYRGRPRANGGVEAESQLG
ncbi:O-antigen/teichoic acid export membrane protein [Sphingomonas kaistensis]|uniref:O-antigen/teichoic acid export membrane protein n=1 Tax=Sphingomonas kaistensis TaxID=298708 RepID=A0A7X6BGU0_9SPHN|nr:oligosaccharide flippase family protein [Sphingomonas kaistensis]NJC06218.1 O-antigen/teichoic acid export membrane protein [Sphingomonas kaistensis]